MPLSRPLSRSLCYGAGTKDNLPVDHRLLGLSSEYSLGIGAVPWNAEKIVGLCESPPCLATYGDADETFIANFIDLSGTPH